MATVRNKRKVLAVEIKFNMMREIENGKKTNSYVSGICSLKLYDPNDLNNRTEFISAFEQNGSRIKRFRKPERSDVMRYCVSGLSKREMSMYRRAVRSL
jgi:hypothetical protein